MKKVLFKFGTGGMVLLGAVGAFAFAPKRSLALVYAKLVSPGVYSYSNSAPSSPVTCKSNVNTTCTFSSTATAAFFNTVGNGYTTTFPSTRASNPEINVTLSNKIYK